jgi:hypothetical protein
MDQAQDQESLWWELRLLAGKVDLSSLILFSMEQYSTNPGNFSKQNFFNPFLIQ